MVSCTLFTFSNLNRSKSSTQTNPSTPRSWHFLLLSTQANSVECCATELPPSINKKKKYDHSAFLLSVPLFHYLMPSYLAYIDHLLMESFTDSTLNVPATQPHNTTIHVKYFYYINTYLYCE